ncbi:MAG: EpsG family protein [Clostridium sp.]|nr:EpsG family protein [Clostridium sp.]
MKVKNSLIPAAVVILICFFSVRYNYTNDYWAYSFWYKNIVKYPYSVVVARFKDVEFGWYWLNKMFAPIGFQGLIVFCTIIQFGTIGWLIKKYVRVKYQWMILSIYLFWPQMMLVQMSMLRQMVAMSIICMGIPSLLRRRWIIYITLILIGSLFHTSALFGIMLIPLYFLRNKNYKIILTGFMSVVAILLLLPNLLSPIINLLIASESFEKYKVYVMDSDQNTMRSGIGFIFQILMVVYFIFTMRWDKQSEKFFMLCLISYYAMTPLFATMGSAGRLGYYFVLPGLIGLQVPINRARRDFVSMWLMIGFFLYILLNYVTFFYDPTFIKCYLHYTTIFD